MAVSGVLSDGFQITQSPQTAAIKAFQDHTATGKLNAEITPTTPSGCHCSYMRCSGRSLAHGEPVELARKADGEVGDVDHLLNFAFAFGQDLAHFERDQRAEIVFEPAQLVADLAHDLAALGGGEHAPAFEYFDARATTRS